MRSILYAAVGVLAALLFTSCVRTHGWHPVANWHAQHSVLNWGKSCIYAAGAEACNHNGYPQTARYLRENYRGGPDGASNTQLAAALDRAHTPHVDIYHRDFKKLTQYVQSGKAAVVAVTAVTKPCKTVPYMALGKAHAVTVFRIDDNFVTLHDPNGTLNGYGPVRVVAISDFLREWQGWAIVPGAAP